MTTSDRRLIVNADDFGLSPSVDRGIADAVAAGSVTSMSVMANLVDVDALARVAAAHPRVSVGAHLNLTTGRPLSPPEEVRSLVDGDGRFFPLDVVTRKAFRRRLNLAEAARELNAQVSLLSAAGVAVDHLDSHEHVHLLPGLTGVVVRLGWHAGVRRIRSHRTRLVRPGGVRVADVVGYYRRHPRRIVTHLAKRVIARRLAHAGLRGPDGMVASSLLARPVAGGPLAEWRAIAEGLPAGTWELVVHPADLRAGLADGEQALLGDLVERRDAEHRALASPAFHAAVEAAGVTLVSFVGTPVRRPVEGAHVARSA